MSQSLAIWACALLGAGCLAEEAEPLTGTSQHAVQSRTLGFNGRSLGMNGRSIGMNGRSIGMNGRSIGMNGRSIGMNGRFVGGGDYDFGGLHWNTVLYDGVDITADVMRLRMLDENGVVLPADDPLYDELRVDLRYYVAGAVDFGDSRTFDIAGDLVTFHGNFGFRPDWPEGAPNPQGHWNTFLYSRGIAYNPDGLRVVSVASGPAPRASADEVSIYSLHEAAYAVRQLADAPLGTPEVFYSQFSDSSQFNPLARWCQDHDPSLCELFPTGVPPSPRYDTESLCQSWDPEHGAYDDCVLFGEAPAGSVMTVFLDFQCPEGEQPSTTGMGCEPIPDEPDYESGSGSHDGSSGSDSGDGSGSDYPGYDSASGSDDGSQYSGSGSGYSGYSGS